MTMINIENKHKNELYAIVREFAQSHDLTGYGNGFDRKGTAYSNYLIKVRDDFKVWIEQHYPKLLEE